jgi:chromosomal replication initiation ATPase DnaA
MYEEIIKTESEELIEIVNENFFTDMLSKNRKREVVDARRAYAKILRDRGYTFELISRTIGKDHATILHYVRTIDSILSYDKEFRDKYLLCKNAFLSNKESASIYKKEKGVRFITPYTLSLETNNMD